MGFLDKFERTLEKAVRRPFSSRSGELQPVELASAVRNAVDRDVVTRRDRNIAPNQIVVLFGTDAFERAREWGAELAQELCDVLLRHAKNQGYTLTGSITVTFRKDASLEEKDFRTLTDFTDDDGNSLDFAPHPAAEGSHAEEARTGDLSAAAEAYGEEPVYEGVISVGGQRYAIEADSITVGRSSEADISVDDPGVSREHLCIFLEDGYFYVKDLGSTNGTHLNGAPLRGTQPLPDGSLIMAANTRILFRIVEREDSQPLSRFAQQGRA